MTVVFIVLAVACVLFWRVALRILAIVAFLLLASGVATWIQNLQHIIK